MARLLKMESPALFDEDLYNASPPPTQRRPTTVPEDSVSPSPSLTSDKENRASNSRLDKGKGRAMLAPSHTPIGNSQRTKRKVMEDRDNASERASTRRRTPGLVSQYLDSDEESDSYDPDQPLEERRRNRQQLRDLNKDLVDNRNEYMNGPDTTALIESLRKADEITDRVKQTADATIDSRFLATAADISYRKTVKLISGDSVQGVDVDEFVSKCMTFMRRANGAIEDGPRAATQASGTQRRRRIRGDEDGEELGDEGDMLNWEHLGHFACLQHNSRPAIPGFLLGPLSLEKRVRKVAQRRVNNDKKQKETRPEELQAEDIQKNENANLTHLCMKIMKKLESVTRERAEAIEEEAERLGDMTEEEQKALLDKYGLHSSGGLDLFKFVINPYSFGQTVENLFYVSFLIRDGKAGLIIDEDGIPSIEATQPRDRTDTIAKGAMKHQAVLAIDMATWKELIEVFNIKKPMIDHRGDEAPHQVGGKGWFS